MDAVRVAFDLGYSDLDQAVMLKNVQMSPRKLDEIMSVAWTATLRPEVECAPIGLNIKAQLAWLLLDVQLLP